MKLMYWNCTSPGLGGNSFARAKKEFIGEVVRRLDPDYLCLDEMSGGVSDASSSDRYATNVLNGPGVSYSSGAVSVNPGVHLNTATFIKDGVTQKHFQVGLPSQQWGTDRTKRDLTKCPFRIGMKDYAVWFLHANASASGGLAAARLADTNADGTTSIFIGDFNCPIGNAQGAVAPDLGGHAFSQWTRGEFGTAEVPRRRPPLKYTPNSVIDYAICDGAKVRIQALDSVGLFGDDGLLSFIRDFDHFPVLYEVT